MGKIFHHAIKVLVWLGEAADDSDLLFEHIGPREGWGYQWDGPLDFRTATAMLSFYSRPYGRRVWVIQELLGARCLDLFCGTKCLPMDTYHWGFTSFLSKMRILEKDGKFPIEYTAGGVENLLETSPGCVILRQQYGGKTEDFSLLRLLEMCANCQSECQLVHDRIYGLIGLLELSQQRLIVPDYSKLLSQVYADILVSLLVPDSASDSHWVTLWGYRGKDLIVSTRTVQNLLENPLWNKATNSFLPIRSICSTSQMERMRALRLDLWMEGVGAISEVGDALLPEELSANDSPLLQQVGGMKNGMFQFLRALEDLDISEYHRTQEIGTRYMKLTDPTDTPFAAIEDENAGMEILSQPSTAINRLFTTKNGLLGYASPSVQKGDLLYGFSVLEDLFLGTQNLFLIIRPGTNPTMHSFTLVGRAILLPVPEERYCDFYTQGRKGKYAKFDFKKDLVAEGTVPP